MSVPVVIGTVDRKLDDWAGVIAYWPFDVDGHDDTGQGHDLSIVGAAVFDDGLFGNALSLSGSTSQYATLADITRDAEFDFGANDFAIQVWVKFNSLSGEQTLIEKFENTNPPGWSLTKLADNRLRFHAQIAIDSNVGLSETDRWYHIVVTRRGSELAIVLDGSTVATGNSSAPIATTSHPLLIGKRNDRDTRNFALNGRVEEVAIWNRALSNTEISLLNNDGMGLPLDEWIRSQQQHDYSLQILGTFGGSTSIAYDVNSSGQVVGGADTTDGIRHAFLWENGVLNDLGTLPGGTRSEANAINDVGQIVGWSDVDSNGTTHAFFWQHDVGMIDLGTLGGPSSRANDINNQGRVIGWSYTPDGSFDAAMWRPVAAAQFTSVNLGNGNIGSSQSTSINDLGQIVGVGDNGNRNESIYWETASGPASFEMLDTFGACGNLNACHGRARSISDAGEIVAVRTIRPPTSASDPALNEALFLTDRNATPTALPFLPRFSDYSTDAYSIDDRGNIVGFAALRNQASFHNVPANEPSRAVLWDPTRRVWDLNDLVEPTPWELSLALGVDNMTTSGDAELIVGQAKLGNVGQAYLAVDANLISEPDRKQWIVEVDLSSQLDQVIDPSLLESAKIRLDYFDAAVEAASKLSAYVLRSEGDGRITSSDLDAAQLWIGDLNVPTATSGQIDLELISTVKESLQAGKTRLTLRLEAIDLGAALQND